jgi:hypothetical protein
MIDCVYEKDSTDEAVRVEIPNAVANRVVEKDVAFDSGYVGVPVIETVARFDTGATEVDESERPGGRFETEKVTGPTTLIGT